MQYTFKNGNILSITYDGEIHIDSYELKEGEHWVTSKEDPKHRFVINENGEITKGLGGQGYIVSNKRAVSEGYKDLLEKTKIELLSKHTPREETEKKQIEILSAMPPRSVIYAENTKWTKFPSGEWVGDKGGTATTKSLWDYANGNITILNEQGKEILPIKDFDKELKKCKSLKRLNEIATEHLSSTMGRAMVFDIKKTEIDVAKEWVDTVVDIDKEFKLPLQQLSTTQLSGADGECDVATGTTIKLNIGGEASGVVTKEKCKRKNTDTNIEPYTVVVDDKNANISVLIHEIGHSIACSSRTQDRLFFEKVNKVYQEYKQDIESKVKEYKRLKRAKRKIDEWEYSLEDCGITQKELDDLPSIENHIRKNVISQYASSEVDEFLAESFCQARLRTQASPYAKRVYELIKEHYGK